MAATALSLSACVALGIALQTGAAPPAPASPAAAPAAAASPNGPGKAKPAPRERLVVVDDRAVKDQAPAAFIDRVIAEVHRRKGLRAVRLSAVRSQLAAAEDEALGACGDDAGCIATAGRALGASAILLVRMTRRDGEEARFLATTRINALRPQIQDEAGGIAGSEADALPLVADQVGEVFPDAELR